MRRGEVTTKERERLMGLKDSEHMSAGGCVGSLLRMLYFLRQRERDSKCDRDLDSLIKRQTYKSAQFEMYDCAFGQRGGLVYDPRRKTQWFLGEKVEISSILSIYNSILIFLVGT